MSKVPLQMENDREPLWWENNYTINADGCWIWLGGTNNLGYGTIKVAGQSKKAHRVFWEKHKGAIPDNMHVLHKCDVRDCINPDHLFLGTHQDNVDDMIAKGRNASRAGVLNGRARLTEDQVIEILDLLEEDQLKSSEIADLYDVARTTIVRIKYRGWPHLKENRK